MTVIKYIPIDYFTYNRPYYVATVLIVTMFSIIYIMLYLIFKYEYLNRLEICDPMCVYWSGNIIKIYILYFFVLFCAF